MLRYHVISYHYSGSRVWLLRFVSQQVHLFSKKRDGGITRSSIVPAFDASRSSERPLYFYLLVTGGRHLMCSADPPALIIYTYILGVPYTTSYEHRHIVAYWE